MSFVPVTDDIKNPGRSHRPSGMGLLVSPTDKELTQNGLVDLCTNCRMTFANALAFTAFSIFGCGFAIPLSKAEEAASLDGVEIPRGRGHKLLSVSSVFARTLVFKLHNVSFVRPAHEKLKEALVGVFWRITSWSTSTSTEA